MKQKITFLAILMAFVLGCKEKKQVITAELQISGAWKLVASDLFPNFSDSSSVGALKIFSNGHFNVSTYNKNTGKLLTCNGGTYIISGNSYTEKIIFSNFPAMPNTQADFTIKLKGTRMYIEGTVRDGKAKLKEIWERIQE